MSREALEAAKRAKEGALVLSAHDVFRGAGDDLYIANGTATTYQGDSGNDTVSYHTSASAVGISLNSGTATSPSFGGDAAGDILINIENAVGSRYSDYLIGNQRDNVLIGLEGNDTIYGGGGDDFIYGDAGRDALFGSAFVGETVFMDGGTDADTITFRTNGGDAEIVTGSGIDKLVVEVMSGRDFHIVVKDFQPYIEHGTVPTNEESLFGDNLLLRFNEAISPGTDIADLAHFSTFRTPSSIILDFDHPDVSGQIVFEGLGYTMGNNDWMWVSHEGFSPAAIIPPI